MSLEPRMIVTRVARQVSAASTSTSSNAASAATTAASRRQDTSGLSPIEVALTLAILLGVFVLLLIVGELCKVFNKPKAKALPYLSEQKQKLFQPSAAGYGTRAAGLNAPEGNAAYSSRAGLMDAASPMGRGGLVEDHGDVSVTTPGSSKSTDYFGKAGHNRGQSSGIKLPGATAATSRRGLAAHPMLPGAPVAPDGSGFQVGQVVNHNNAGPGPSGYASRPAGLSPSERLPGPRTSNVGMGSPPASDAKRRSRYARADGRRVDSVGPGTIRKSMYLSSDGQPSEGMPRTASNNNLRRVDSVGRGDHRRKSTFTTDAGRENRSQSIYNADGENAGKIGFARDPLNARRPMMPASGGSNTEYPMRAVSQPYQQQSYSQQQSPYQQQPSQQQQTGMPTLQRQVSPLPSQSGASNGPLLSRPMQPIRGFSGMSAGGYGPPVAKSYDMKTRQVV